MSGKVTVEMFSEKVVYENSCDSLNLRKNSRSQDFALNYLYHSSSYSNITRSLPSLCQFCNAKRCKVLDIIVKCPFLSFLILNKSSVRVSCLTKFA